MQELFLARVILSGLFISVIIAVFFLLRHFYPQLINGSLRRFIWQFSLAVVILTLVWPKVIYYPLNTPEWFFRLQLFRNNNSRILYFLLQEAEHSLIMRIWRTIFPAGALAYVVISRRLLWNSKNSRLHLRRMKSREERAREAGDLDLPAWENYLALWRDKLGYYRRAELRLESVEENLWEKIYRRYRKIITVDRKKPPEEINDRSGALLLDRLHHPYIITCLLHRIVQILLWFVPGLWLSTKYLQSDLQLDREERIARKLNRSKAKKMILLPARIRQSSVIVILLVVALAFFWQLPAVYLPGLETAEAKIPQENFGLTTVMAQDRQQIREALNKSDLDRLLFDSQEPILYLQDGEIRLVKFRQDGYLQWQTIIPLDTALVAVSYIPKIISIELIESRMLPGDELYLLCATENEFNMIQYWHIHLKAAGELISVQRIDQQMSELVKDYNLCLASDGGYLAYAYDEYLHLWRFDRRGKLIWQKKATDIFHSEKPTPANIKALADNDGGFFLVAGNSLKYGNMHNTHNEYLCIMAYRLDSKGDVVYSREISNPDRSYSIYTSTVDEQNLLYLGGSVRFTKSSLIYSDQEILEPESEYIDPGDRWTCGILMAVDPENNSLWQKIIPLNYKSSLEEILIQDKTISVLMYALRKENAADLFSRKKFLWQLDLNGKIIARKNIESDDILYVEPGRFYIEEVDVPVPEDPVMER